MAIKTVKEELEKREALKDADVVSSLLYAAESQNAVRQTVWHTLVCLILKEGIESSEQLAEYLSAHIPPGLLENAPLSKKGVIQYRTWKISKNLWKYNTTVLKAVANTSLEEVFPSDKPIPTLSEVKELAYVEKKEKSDIDKFIIVCNTLNALYGKMTVEDQQSASNALKTVCTFVK